MAEKIEIIDNFLVVTDTVTSVVRMAYPSKDCWYDTYELDEGRIVIVDIQKDAGDPDSVLFTGLFSDSVDSSSVAWANEDALRSFFRTNLASTGSGGGGGATAFSGYPLHTGQTVSYANNDDGFIQFGREVDFTTLSWTNPVGDTNRFTDELGGQTFTNDIFIDWTSYNPVLGKVLGYCFAHRNYPILDKDSISITVNRSWADWMLGQPYTKSGFGSWYVANKKMMQTLVYEGAVGCFNYSPINLNIINGSQVQYTSTTRPSSNLNCWIAYVGSSQQWFSKTTGTGSALLYREFTVGAGGSLS